MLTKKLSTCVHSPAEYPAQHCSIYRQPHRLPHSRWLVCCYASRILHAQERHNLRREVALCWRRSRRWRVGRTGGLLCRCGCCRCRCNAVPFDNVQRWRCGRCCRTRYVSASYDDKKGRNTTPRRHQGLGTQASRAACSERDACGVGTLQPGSMHSRVGSVGVSASRRGFALYSVGGGRIYLPGFEPPRGDRIAGDMPAGVDADPIRAVSCLMHSSGNVLLFLHISIIFLVLSCCLVARAGCHSPCPQPTPLPFHHPPFPRQCCRRLPPSWREARPVSPCLVLSTLSFQYPSQCPSWQPVRSRQTHRDSRYACCWQAARTC